MKHNALRRVLKDTVPVLAGYLFLGAGFGILLRESGYGIGWAFFMSLCMFAGSAQYLAVSLLVSQASLLSAALATSFVNARHIFYGLSLVEEYKNTGFKKNYLIFGLTDETYSLVTQNQPPEGMSRQTYFFGLTLFDHMYWILGSVLGHLLGAALPVSFTGVEFVLTALFVTMFVEQWLSNPDHRPAVVGVMSTALCLLVFGKEVFLLPSMALITLLLLLSKKATRRDCHA